MSQSPDAAEVAAEIGAWLSGRSIDYAIGGALGLGFWTDPRGTLDVDLTLFMAPDRPAETIQVLAELGCDFAHHTVVESLREHGYCRVWYRGVNVDVFLPTIPFYEQAKLRRRRVDLGGQAIDVWEAEVLCVFKMMFLRAKDLFDVEKLVQTQADELDRDWVRAQLVDIFGRYDPRISNWDEIVERARG